MSRRLNRGIRVGLQLLLLLSIAGSPGHCKGAARVKGARANRNSGNRVGSGSGSSGSSLPLLMRSRFSLLAKVMAYRMGIIFATHSWRLSHPDYSDSMTVCYNVQEALPPDLLSSVIMPWSYQNRTVYGLYVCPVDDQLDNLYCCGTKDAQVCCSFWDDWSRFSSVVVGATLAFLSCWFFAVWLYRWSQRHLRWNNQVHSHVALELPSEDSRQRIKSASASAKAKSRKRPKQPLPRRQGARPLSYYWDGGQDV